MTFEAIKIFGIPILYLMIGIFLCTIANGLDCLYYDDDYVIPIIIFWPLILGLAIFAAVVILFPQWLAGVIVDAIKKWKGGL